MATPDLSTLMSSAQIFSSNYTLPQIRSIHKAVHVQIEEKASRLRTQVGGSYRELLGTADTIVQMRGDNEQVQSILGGMGGRCGRAVVRSKVSGLETFTETEKDRAIGDGPRMGQVAKAKLLEACGLVVGRILKGGRGLGDDALSPGDKLVLATKIFVLSRLLAKSLEGQVEDLALLRLVEAANKSLANLKNRLLRSINKMLDRVGSMIKQADVLKALCAYSIATSSGAKDVVRHLLRIRGNAIALSFEVTESERERSTNDVLKAVTLYTQTLLDVQALVPFKLSQALAALKKQPLLADESLKRLEGLRLDVYERWCGDDIQFYTPFIRHDDLDGPQAKDMLQAWSAQGSEVLIGNLKKTLARVSEFNTITDMRTQVLQLWIKEGGRARGFDPSEIQSGLRQAFNDHTLKVLEAKVNKLHLVGSEVSATLGSWQSGVTDKRTDMWDEDAFDMSLPNGAASLFQDLLAVIHGRNDSVSKVINCYKSWHHVIDDVGEVVEQLRKQRWDNDTEEIEDEETIEARQQLLSRDDPRILHERLNATLESAFKKLDDQLAGLWKQKAEDTNRGPIAMYFLRVLRDIRRNLPEKDYVKQFGLAIVPSLHGTLASTVCVSSLEDFSSSALARKTVVGRSLWEGNPELPSQPSPGAFAFLRHLQDAMADAGMDLWTSAAMKLLKKHVSKQLCELWLAALDRHLADAAAEEKLKQEVKDTKQSSKEAEKIDVSDASENKAEGETESPEKETCKDKEDVKAETTTDPSEDNVEASTDEDDINLAADKVTAQQRRDLLIQWLFDISLLNACFEPEEFKRLEETIYEKAGLENAASRERIIKASRDYWDKTSLLFGLLA
jgi:conserved oligomeric Golgi complex subunit 1